MINEFILQIQKTATSSSGFSVALSPEVEVVKAKTATEALKKIEKKYEEICDIKVISMSQVLKNK